MNHRDDYRKMVVALLDAKTVVQSLLRQFNLEGNIPKEQFKAAWPEPKEGQVKANKTEVWREFVSLLSSCPTQYNKHVAVASLLTHLFDDDELDNNLLIEAIQKAHKSLGGMKKPCRSVGMSVVSERYP